MKEKILVIENKQPHFTKIKKNLESIYTVIPSENFAPDVFEDPKELSCKIEKLLNTNENKNSLVGVILDANLKDHRGIINDISGINDILPFIRNQIDDLIPIIIFTKFSELKEKSLNNLANYFVEKQYDLSNQVKTEIRWILNVLKKFYLNQLHKKSFFIIEEIVNNIQNEVSILLEQTKNINEMIDLFLPKISKKIKKNEERIIITIYLILNLFPEKKDEIINSIMDEMGSNATNEIREKVEELKRQNFWENLKKLTIEQILNNLIGNFGVNLTLNAIMNYLSNL